MLWRSGFHGCYLLAFIQKTIAQINPIAEKGHFQRKIAKSCNQMFILKVNLLAASVLLRLRTECPYQYHFYVQLSMVVLVRHCHLLTPAEKINKTILRIITVCLLFKFLQSDFLSHLMPLVLSVPPENIKNHIFFWCFQGV